MATSLAMIFATTVLGLFVPGVEATTGLIPATVTPASRNTLLINGEKQALPEGFEASKAEMERILRAKMGDAYSQLTPQVAEIDNPVQLSILGPFKAHEARLVETAGGGGEEAGEKAGTPTVPDGMVYVDGKLVSKEQAANGDFTLGEPLNGPKRLRPVSARKAATPPAAAAAYGADAEECKVLCQRFAMDSMGPEFIASKNPVQCVEKCDEIFARPVTPSAAAAAEPKKPVVLWTVLGFSLVVIMLGLVSVTVLNMLKSRRMEAAQKGRTK